MPKKLNKKLADPPSSNSASSYTHKEETVVVRYRDGVPIQIVHPQHLTCLRHAPPQPIDKGGRPSVENTVRYVLNRALFNYLYIPQDTPPQPLTRYRAATLALKWCEHERSRIYTFTKTSPKRKEKLVKQFSISRQTIENFLKHFFPKPEQRLSPNELRELFPRLWYQ